MDIDVLSYGETLIRLTPERFKTFLKSSSWQLEIGGAEANVLAGCSLLGLRTQLLTALPNNFLGRRVLQELRGFGVGTNYVALLEKGRMGLYFLEFAHRAGSAEVLYDRKDSAFSFWELGESELSLLSRASLLHLTGVTPPLSPIACLNIKKMLRLKPRSLRVSFDVNYRSKLWSFRECQKFMDDIMEFVDILLVKEEDLVMIFGLHGGTPQEQLAFLQNCYGKGKIYILTARENGCFVLSEDCYFHQPSFVTEVVDSIGAGDAFVAGFLYACLSGKDLKEGALWGNAMASLKMSVTGDMPAFDRCFVESLVCSPHSIERKVSR